MVRAAPKGGTGHGQKAVFTQAEVPVVLEALAGEKAPGQIAR